MTQSDYQMALLLQQQFEHEANIDSTTNSLAYKTKKDSQDKSKSLTDPSWELIDPTPNIHILFIAFNEKYFWNKLLAVCVDWSKRMTSCAGICRYQGRGGMCMITLSEPLLKLRPRKDLVETLLHEMIHAYLFVTHNNRDRDGHGPEFHKHMHRINSEAGTNITVYHSFHDEVRLYLQHWWRCNGPCQHRKPYFGMVRRATNRAPGPNDRWWEQHSQTCGGTFIKVKEPDKAEKKQKSKNENKPAVNSNKDIRSYLPVLKENNLSSSGPSQLNNVIGFKDLKNTKTKNALSNSSSTIVITKKSTARDDSKDGKGHTQKKASVTPFSGDGQALNKENSSNLTDYALVRNHWLNRFPDNNSVSSNIKRVHSDKPNCSKKVKVDKIVPKTNAEFIKCPVCDEEILQTEINAHLDVCLFTSSTNEETVKCPVCDRQVKKGTIDDHMQICIKEIFEDENSNNFDDSCNLISCLVCNKHVPKSDLSQHLDECMSDNVFTNDNEKNKNCDDDEFGVVGHETEYNCPICLKPFTIDAMSGHLDECVNEIGNESLFT